MSKIISSKITVLTFSILALCFAVSFYIVAWTEPLQAPLAGNIETPINTSSQTQEKQGSITAAEFYDYNNPTYYLNPDGNSKLGSVLLVGGASLPACDASSRGKQYMVQGSGGIWDKFFSCKKDSDNSYVWTTF